ncbi:MAG: alpha/beta hydrolase [Oscillatoria sp. SIO1A7]|nr:alpha/beta hydrolase [Oscillatoria sp. SIO1A7]
MPVNVQTRAYIEMMSEGEKQPLEEREPTEVREEVEQKAADIAPEPEAVAEIDNRTIPGPVGAIPIRIYRPEGTGPFPILVYFHGGGWVVGSLETVDFICRNLANGADCIVVSVAYRLAPEHKFPAAAEDAYAATKWAAENAAAIGGSDGKIALAGDSAGGNLAAVVALMARDKGEPSLRYQVLFYPVTHYGFDTQSYEQCAEGYLLSREDMIWFWNCYLASPENGDRPYASPLLAKDLSNLPPALIITAEYDVLRDEGEMYGDRLIVAGVSAKTTRYRGTVHGFLNAAKYIDQGWEALAEAAAELRKVFQV